MANKKDVRMPSSGAGLTTYYDESKSNIRIPPQTVVALIIVIIVLAIILNTL
jgi:preprotein translocase subunit Sec61beta